MFVAWVELGSIQATLIFTKTNHNKGFRFLSVESNKEALNTYKEKIVSETKKLMISIFKYQANLNNAIMSPKN